ncbi:hypothetical protein H0X48_00930 [Candidatus Dependentiae bacterium]|nr:hypothetical protein [Candidatus Dependentiae bacterium]
MSNYSYRRNIEKFFRTAKQSLGLTHCPSVKQKLQENHIMNVFGAFTILQVERRKHALPNPEAALKRLRHKNHASLLVRLCSADQIYG